MNDSATKTKPMRGQAFRFALLSAMSFAVNLMLVYTLHEWAGLSSMLAVPIAMVTVTVMNFYALRWFVFGHDGRSWFVQMACFGASIAGFRLAEYAAFLLIHGALNAPYLISYAGILSVSLVFKFLFLRGTVFRGSQSPKVEACQAS